MAAFTEHTDPAVFTAGITEGWAELAPDPTCLDWSARLERAAIPFEVVNGRPVNPCEKTSVQRGRNGLGFWGENLMADAVVTCRWAGNHTWLLMVERGDGRGWAVPGGAVEPGETRLDAAARELAEETGLTVPAGVWRVGEPTYVPDPRASDEAWAVTVPAYADLGAVDALPAVKGADDARRAAWVRADSYEVLTECLNAVGGEVFAAHVPLLKEFLGHQTRHGYHVVFTVSNENKPLRVDAYPVSLTYRLDTAANVRRLTNYLSDAVGSPVVIVNWLPLLEVA